MTKPLQLWVFAGVITFLLIPCGIFAQGQFETDSIRVMSGFSKGRAMLYNSYGLAALERGELKQSLQYFTEASAIDPDYSAAIFNRGVAQLRLGSPVEALLDFATAIQMDPQPEYLISRGLLLLERGDTVNGLTDFQRASRVGALSRDAAFALGVVKYRQGSYREAIDLFRQVLNLNPGSLVAINGLAMAQLAAGDTTEAIQWIDESLQLMPDQAKVLHLKAGLLLSQNHRAESESTWLQALGINPQDYIALNGLAVIAFHQQQYDTALAYANRAVDANPRHTPSWNTRGNCYFMLGDFQSAESDYSLAISLDPLMHIARHNRGVCREMLRDEQGACEDWKTAGHNGVAPALRYYKEICQ
jgi:tetratricopeptide (TPR) repeat protein